VDHRRRHVRVRFGSTFRARFQVRAEGGRCEIRRTNAQTSTGTQLVLASGAGREVRVRSVGSEQRVSAAEKVEELERLEAAFQDVHHIVQQGPFKRRDSCRLQL